MVQGIIEFFATYGISILNAVGEHLYMTMLSVSFAVIIGIPLGIICSYMKGLAKVIMGMTNITQAIPSLAILGILIPVLGIGSTPAIVMVTTYSLLPIVKNTYTGITGIDPTLLEASDGIGVKRWERLMYVELPLSLPVIMSGIRIAAVTAVGTMTIAAFVGGGGLGTFIFEGIGMVNYQKILMGAIPAALLALIIDNVIFKLETMLVNRQQAHKKQNKKSVLILTAVAVVIVSVFATRFFVAKHDIVVGSKNYSEQIILGNMLSDLIEHDTDLSVKRELSLGNSNFVFEAIKSKNIDAYIEYSGSAYLTYLGNTLQEGDTTASIMEKTKAQLADVGITAFPSVGFNNTYGIGVTRELMEKHNLKTISDLVAISSQVDFVSTIDFMQRPDGWIGLNDAYTFNFNTMKTSEDTLRFQAVANGQASALEIYQTEGLIAKYDIQVLEDDLLFFASYHAFPMIRAETLEKHSELKTVMDKMENKVTEEDMRRMNYEVIVNNREAKDVARAFLVDNNWLN